MSNNLLENLKNNNIELNNNELQTKQNQFLNTNLGKAINKGIDVGLKVILPDCIEDEIISVKDSLLTEGFSAAVDTAIEEATNIGKSAIGLVTGTFENLSQVKKAVKSGGLIDTVSGLLDVGIKWGKDHGYIKSSIAGAIKKGKNTIMKNIKTGVDNTLDNQVEAIDKIDGYIDKWYKYLEEKNFQKMEYQYKKIQEYQEKIFPIQNTLQKVNTVQNLHELIKNRENYENRFELTEQEKELAEMLAK